MQPDGTSYAARCREQYSAGRADCGGFCQAGVQVSTYRMLAAYTALSPSPALGCVYSLHHHPFGAVCTAWYSM